jgi:ABC-type transport system involved in multi-copper enzyme maturation permease subunit
MFGRIAAFEIRYQLRSPVFWVVFALFFLLAFGAMASSQISLGGVPDNAQQNGTLGLALTQG